VAEYMTKKGYEQLKKKMDELKQRRTKISKTIGEAREHGDLRENSAYHAAKEEQGLNEMRIREMEAKLANAEIVEGSTAAKKDKVSLGATVKVQAVKTEREMEFTLVSASEADILEITIGESSSCIFDEVDDDEKNEIECCLNQFNQTREFTPRYKSNIFIQIKERLIFEKS